MDDGVDIPETVMSTRGPAVLKLFQGVYVICKRLVFNFCPTRTTINPTLKTTEKGWQNIRMVKAQELFIRSLSTFSPHKKNYLTDYKVQQEIYLVLQFKT